MVGMGQKETAAPYRPPPAPPKKKKMAAARASVSRASAARAAVAAPAAVGRDKAIAKIDTILGPGYYHNRYWNMWKLPLLGCTDGTQVISEIKECLQTYPDVTVRVIAFDRQRQVQVAGFIVQK